MKHLHSSVALWKSCRNVSYPLFARKPVSMLLVRFYDLAVSPDGERLAAACSDNTIRLWDLQRGEEVAVLSGHTDYVHGLDFSADGTRLVSGSGDGTVRVWDSVSVSTRAAISSP